jgi:hypothetical protein
MGAVTKGGSYLKGHLFSLTRDTDRKGKYSSLRIWWFVGIVTYGNFLNRWEFMFAMRDFRKKPKDLYIFRIFSAWEIGK